MKPSNCNSEKHIIYLTVGYILVPYVTLQAISDFVYYNIVFCQSPIEPAGNLVTTLNGCMC